MNVKILLICNIARKIPLVSTQILIKGILLVMNYTNMTLELVVKIYTVVVRKCFVIAGSLVRFVVEAVVCG